MVAPIAAPGGAEEILFNLAACLPQFAISPAVVSLDDGPLVDRLRAAGVEVSVIEAGRLREVDRFWRTSRALGAALNRHETDVVFSNMPKAHLYAACPARMRHLPAFWCQAGYPEPASLIDRLASALPAAGVIALSREAATAQQRLRPGPPVHLMHPGTDLARFRLRKDEKLREQYQIPQDAILISLVGRLQPWKGQREFLRSGARLDRATEDVRLAIVGGAILGWEGDYPRELEQLAETLGLGGKVIFTGHTNDPERWMAASDIIVNASQPEPFGLVLVEAMASGCAVVAVSAGGPNDIIENGHSGLLCSTKHPQELADAIGRLVRDPILRRSLGKAGRARVEACFSRERMTARFSEIIRGEQSEAHFAEGRTVGSIGPR